MEEKNFNQDFLQTIRLKLMMMMTSHKKMNMQMMMVVVMTIIILINMTENAHFSDRKLA